MGTIREQVDYLYKYLDPERGSRIFPRGFRASAPMVENIIKAYWTVVESMLLSGRCVKIKRIGTLLRATNKNGSKRVKLIPSATFNKVANKPQDTLERLYENETKRTGKPTAAADLSNKERLADTAIKKAGLRGNLEEVDKTLAKRLKGRRLSSTERENLEKAQRALDRLEKAQKRAQTAAANSLDGAKLRRKGFLHTKSPRRTRLKLTGEIRLNDAGEPEIIAERVPAARALADQLERWRTARKFGIESPKFYYDPYRKYYDTRHSNEQYIRTQAVRDTEEYELAPEIDDEDEDGAQRAYKVVLVCNSGAPGLTRRMVQSLGSRNIFLDSAVYPATIYSYLKSGFRLVGTPSVGQRGKRDTGDARETPAAAFMSAPSYTVDETLALIGFNPQTDFGADFTSDDRKMLLSALIVKAYFRSNGFNEGEAAAKARQWPQATTEAHAAVRQTYLDIVKRKTRPPFVSLAAHSRVRRALQSSGILAADPTAADEATINNPGSYEFYFNSTITMRYDAAAATPFTAPESTGTSAGGLPAPITLDSLRSCTGSMQGEVEPDVVESEKGVRAELRSIREYAQMRGTRVYARAVENGFWVAVGL